MLSRSEPVVDSALQVLHPRAIRDRQRIREVLADAQRCGAIFHRGLNSAADLELGRLAKLRDDMLVLDTQGFNRPTNGQIFLNFESGGRPCLFVTRRCGPPIDGQLHVRVPETIFFSERRDRLRHQPKSDQGEPRRLEMRTSSGRWQQGVVTDICPGGFGVEIKGDRLFSEIATLHGLNTKALDIIRAKRVGSSIVGSTVRTNGARPKVVLYDSAITLHKPMPTRRRN